MEDSTITLQGKVTVRLDKQEEKLFAKGSGTVAVLRRSESVREHRALSSEQDSMTWIWNGHGQPGLCMGFCFSRSLSWIRASLA